VRRENDSANAAEKDGHGEVDTEEAPRQESRTKNPMDLDGSGEQVRDMLIELLRRLLQPPSVPAVLAFHAPGFGRRDVAA